MYSEEEGAAAVRGARRAVEASVQGKRPPRLDLPASFNRKAGVFVTLTTYPSGDLRGCIGFPEPIFPLAKALPDAAISAALRDPRFPPVRPSELERLLVEVSLLTPPAQVVVSRPKEYPAHVRVGQDGLIIERGGARGLLLPQVAVEYGWDAEEFLAHTCAKAGLLPDAWLQDGTRLYRFQAEIFTEVSPRGEIRRHALEEPDGSRR